MAHVLVGALDRQDETRPVGEKLDICCVGLAGQIIVYQVSHGDWVVQYLRQLFSTPTDEGRGNPAHGGKKICGEVVNIGDSISGRDLTGSA